MGADCWAHRWVGPGWLAWLIHQPTKLGLWWIDGVAWLARQLPLGLLGAVHVVALFVIASFGLRQTERLKRAGAAAAIAIVLLQPAVAVATAVPQSVTIDDDSRIWRDETITVVELGPQSRPDEVLSSLRLANVGDIDLVIARSSNFAMASLINWMQTNHHIDAVWAPAITMGVGETPPPPTNLHIANTVLHVRRIDNQLTVTRS